MYRKFAIIFTINMLCCFDGFAIDEYIQFKIDSLINYGSKISNSESKKALEIIDSAIHLSRKYNYYKGEAEAIRKKGLAYFYLINYDEALSHFLDSKTKFIKLNDTVGISKANNMIAITYGYHGLHEKSLSIHQDNLLLQLKINDIEGISASYNNIGVELKNLNKLDDALSYYQKAVEYELKLKDSISLSRYYDNIGSLFLQLGNIDSAYIYINMALVMRNKINDLQGIKGSLESLGDYYYQIGKFKKAKEFQERSLEYANKIGIVYEIASITKKLSKTYFNLGNLKEAYQALNIHDIMQDSIEQNATNDMITKLEINNALEKEQKIRNLIIEKKELEREYEKNNAQNLYMILITVVISSVLIIAVIWINLNNNQRLNAELIKKQDEIVAQNEEIKKQHISISEQNNLLTKLNAEKDKFFSIIAHDLKSPFSGFLGLTKELADNYKFFEKEDVKEYATNLQESAINLFKLLENLLEWSRIQRGITQFNPDNCNINLIVKQNINIQFEVARQKQIELINNVSEDLYAQIDVSMINTVIRNLLSNSIKFTPRGGRIEINARKIFDENNNHESILIEINDNGIGMDDKIKNNLFKIDQKVSRPGTENEPSSGIGLLLCKEFVSKHNGDIWVESEIGRGSTFYFTLK